MQQISPQSTSLTSPFPFLPPGFGPQPVPGHRPSERPGRVQGGQGAALAVLQPAGHQAPLPPAGPRGPAAVAGGAAVPQEPVAVARGRCEH